MAFSNAGVIVARRLIAGSIDVPAPGVIGFHVDSTGNLGVGGVSATSGPFQVSAAGVISATSLNVNAIATGTLSWGSGSSLLGSDAIDMPVRPANQQPVLRESYFQDVNKSLSIGGVFVAPGGPVAGNLLVVIIGATGTSITSATITGPAGWTRWTGAPFTQGVNTIGDAYFKVAAGGDAGPVWTLSNFLAVNVAEIALCLYEYQGMNAVPADVFANTSGTSTQPNTGTTANTTQAIDLGIGFCFHLEGTYNFGGPTNGYKVQDQIGTSCRLVVLTKSLNTIGAQTSTVAQNPPPPQQAISANWVGAMATFKTSSPPTPGAGHSQIVGLTHGSQVSLGVVTPQGVTVDLLPAYGSLSADTASIANTETVVISASIPANFLQVGTTFSILASGPFTFAAGTSTFRIRIGPTALTGSIAGNVSPVNAASGQVTVIAQFTCRTTGAGGSGAATGIVISSTSFTNQLPAIQNATAAVDTTVANFLCLTYISGAAGASMVFRNATWNLTEW